MPQQLLADLGLSASEIEIYTALLPLGNAPASVLGNRTQMPRSTARFNCDNLVEKGLFQKSQKGHTTVYTAEPPEKILYLLDQKKKALAATEERAHRVLNELQSLYNPSLILPKVRFFEGRDGLIKLYNEILDFRETISSFEDKGEMTGFFEDYVKSFIGERIEREILNRVICPSSTPINFNSKKEHREVRSIPVEDFPFSCDIKICGDQVSIFSFEQNTAVGIAIRHRDIARNFQLLFDYLWKRLTTEEAA